MSTTDNEFIRWLNSRMSFVSDDVGHGDRLVSEYALLMEVKQVFNSIIRDEPSFPSGDIDAK